MTETRGNSPSYPRRDCRLAPRSETFYVKRSPKMANYPLVWSLMSIQFDPATLNPLDTASVQPLMEKMAQERLSGAPLRVSQYLSSASCADNPMHRRVFLHLYAVELLGEPRLNPDYYVDSAWLEPSDYRGPIVGRHLRSLHEDVVRLLRSESPHGSTLRAGRPAGG